MEPCAGRRGGLGWGRTSEVRFALLRVSLLHLAKDAGRSDHPTSGPGRVFVQPTACRAQVCSCASGALRPLLQRAQEEQEEVLSEGGGDPGCTPWLPDSPSTHTLLGLGCRLPAVPGHRPSGSTENRMSTL